MPKLNYLEVAGSPFDAGRTLGQFGAAAMHSYARESTAWATVMRHRGSALVNEMADLVRSRFPRVWEELQGMATGLELPFEDVFLWNCRGDLWAMAPDGCTTVQQPGTVRRITHNEDGDPAFAGHCGIVSYAVDGGVPLASFVYPGSIPGHTFAVTQSGLAMTVNNLRCLDVEAGVPRMVLVRALLDTASIDDALELLRGNKRAGGFHLTLAHASTQSLLSVEFSSEMCSVIEIASQSLHANHALHPPALMHAQIVTGSSKHRQRRGDTLLSGARNAADPLEILSDRGDADFPILRTDPQDSDGENTMATADIHVGPERIEWWVHEAPSEPARFHMIGVHATENRSEPCTPLD